MDPQIIVAMLVIKCSTRDIYRWSSARTVLHPRASTYPLSLRLSLVCGQYPGEESGESDQSITAPEASCSNTERGYSFLVIFLT
jgi:hypothetical protein